MNSKTLWKIVTVVELVAAAAVILLDLFLPTIVILVLAFVSLLVRREKTRSLGFKRPKSWPRMAGLAFVGAVLLQLFDVGVAMPILNRLTGTTLDYRDLAELKGNLGQLLLLLALSWTLAALGEEIVYRGYLQKRLTDLLGTEVNFPGYLQRSGSPACCSV